MNYEALIVSVVVVVGVYALTRWFTLDVKCECGHELRDHTGSSCRWGAACAGVVAVGSGHRTSATLRTRVARKATNARNHGPRLGYCSGQCLASLGASSAL